MVIGIDGGWGTGKSTFAQMLQAHLKNEGFNTSYIDAFAVDYVEDPFVPILARLQALIKDNKDSLDRADDFFKKAARIGGVLLSKLGSASANIAMQVALISATGTPLLGIDQIGAKAAEAWDELAARRINAFLQEEKSIQAYKVALAGIAAAHYELHNKPLVIMVDELDRCKPDFAVLFLERIKHFFDVPHLAFILLINGDQLEKSIRGCYGAELDAQTYLQKFISLNYEIEPADKIGEHTNQMNEASPIWEKLIESHLRRYGITAPGLLLNMTKFLRELDLTPRDLDKMGGIVFSSGVTFDGNFTEIRTWFLLAALKIKNIAAFRAVMRRDSILVVELNPNAFLAMLRPALNDLNSQVHQTLEEFKNPDIFSRARLRKFWQWIHQTLEPQSHTH